MSAIIIRLAILITGFTIIAGCKPAIPGGNKPTKWDIIMTSPMGQSDTYTVESWAKPQIYLMQGGQTLVRDNGYSGLHEWEDSIVAPTGWRLEVKPHEAKAEIEEWSQKNES